MKKKISLALGAIAAMLIISGVISVLEFRRMSTTVSELIAEDIENINVSQKIAGRSERFNLQILQTVGSADSLSAVTNFDLASAITECEDVFLELADVRQMPLTDTLMDVFIAYLDEASMLEVVVPSDFKDSRLWYFTELQPRYNDLTSLLEDYNDAIHEDLKLKAEDFEAGFYRSIIPGMVTVVAGLLLLFLLLFFILAYYVEPIYRMLGALEDFTQRGRRYTYDFEGDDQLKKLNDCLTEITDENTELRKRISILREQQNQNQEQ